MTWDVCIVLGGTGFMHNAKTIVTYTTAYPFRLPKTSLMCVYCAETVPDPAQFGRHMQEEHPTFWLPAAFAHVLEDNLKVDITDLRCRVCNVKFEDLDTVAKHLHESHSHTIDFDQPLGLHPFKFADRLQCVACARVFPTLRLLSRHTATHYQRYTCEECGRSYSVLNSLQAHVRSAHADGHVCRKCKRIFSTLEARRRHWEADEECRPYRCAECGRRFHTWDVKQTHLVEEHGHEKSRNECVECGLEFRDRKAFARHFERAHSRSVFECPLCEQTFSSRRSQVRHVGFRHGHQQIHRCDVCEKTFSRREYFRKHMREVHRDYL